LASTLEPVPSVHVEIVWPDIVALMTPACERSNGKFTASEIKGLLIEGKMQLWLSWRDGPEAVCVTQIVKHLKRQAVEFLIVTGKNRGNWQHFKDQIEAWAKTRGCDLSRAFARPGWQRVFRDMKTSHVIMEKDL
jgi:hypothetical protein